MESTLLPSLVITHISPVHVCNLDDPTSYGGGQSHGLGTLISVTVLIAPVDSPHLHEVIQDPIYEDSRIMNTELLDNPNGVPPEAIIEEILTKDVLSPGFFVKLLLPGENHSMNQPGKNLAKSSCQGYCLMTYC